MPLGPGSRLDAYELLQRLGAGGMGEVWLATEVRLGRKVALKLLPDELTRDPARVSRFEQEARAASGLSHPNVCTIHALGETAHDQHYIAMEYVEGETLRRRIAGGRLTIRESLDIAIQIASALVAAHTHGIIHRDIKPENVMLRPDGLVKVLDFGLAKLTAATDSAAVEATQTAFRTDAGTVVGTIAYMSPEQARGQQVDARSDIWSLGVVLYEMVAGRSPFAASSSSDMLAAILEHEPAPLARSEPEVPAELQRVVTKALRKDRAQRYQTVQDLLLDLQALRDDVQAQRLSGSSSAVRPDLSKEASTPASVSMLPIRRRMVAAASAALVLAFVAAGVVWWATRSATSATPSGPVQRTLTRLTFGPGLQTGVTFSPDGRFVAYASDRAGNFDIWVQPVAGGDPVQVTTSPAEDTQPAWSPDGSGIVFRSERDPRGLYIVPALGGAQRLLVDQGVHPSWSSDGEQVRFFAETFGHGDAQLYEVSSGGGQPRLVLPEFTANGSWLWIAGHPDGRFSFLGFRRRGHDLGFFTISRDGTVAESDIKTNLPPQLSRFLDGTWDVYGRRFRWNESGTALYLETKDNSGISNLWRVNVDASTMAWTSFDRLTSGPGSDLHAALSRDGTRIAFSTLRESTRLWQLPFGPERQNLLDGRPITEEGSAVSYASVTLDGQFALYNLGRPGASDTTTLWLTDLQSGRSEPVGTDGSHARMSPNKREVAYTKIATDRTLGFAAIAVRALGGAERLITPWAKEWVAATDWIPDGSGVLVSQGNQVLAWPSKGPGEQAPRTVLEVRALGVHGAKFSPNGQWLSLLVVTDQGATIAVAPAEGPPNRKWTAINTEHAWVDKPRWAPDGRRLYFLASEGSFLNVWAVAFDQERGVHTGSAFAVARFTSPAFRIDPGVSFTELDVSPDHVFLTMQSAAGNIWMLDNVDK
jgi:eukaryotic-like serine/threonine-protein kinase